MVVKLSLQLGVASYWLCPEVLLWETGSANPTIYDFNSDFFLKSPDYLHCVQKCDSWCDLGKHFIQHLLHIY